MALLHLWQCNVSRPPLETCGTCWAKWMALRSDRVCCLNRVILGLTKARNTACIRHVFLAIRGRDWQPTEDILHRILFNPGGFLRKCSIGILRAMGQGLGIRVSATTSSFFPGECLRSNMRMGLFASGFALVRR